MLIVIKSVYFQLLNFRNLKTDNCLFILKITIYKDISIFRPALQMEEYYTLEK